MSQFKIEIVKLPEFIRHPNADTLNVVQIWGYPVVFNDANGFVAGQLVSYIPVDAVCPMTPEWAFLGDTVKSHRIRAKRLRGVFSMGLLAPAPEGSQEGQDVSGILGIVKYEEPDPVEAGSENEAGPGDIPHYTNIQNYRRHQNQLVEGEEVLLFEKLHGAQFFCTYRDDRLWVSSHHAFKRRDPNNMWWKIALQEGLEEKLVKYPDTAFYGEVYGQVQDLKYGAKPGQLFLRFFDVLANGKYLNWDEAKKLILDAGLQPVPLLFRGPWSPELLSLAEGKSTLADNIREGFVVRPVEERWNPEVGRVILKVIGESYLTRKGGSEKH